MLSGSSFQRVTTFIVEYLGVSSAWDVLLVILDIGIISFTVYKLIQLLRDSRALQLLKGILLIFVLAFIADFLKLSTVSYFLNVILQILPVLVIVLFQPEFRRVLEGIGKNKFRELFAASGDRSVTDINTVIEEIIKAVGDMSANRVGALIVFERETSLGEIVRTGTIVDSTVSSQLVRLIFVPNTPLHDGAMIIRGSRVYAAGCLLPLTDDLSLSKELGTRHRAGIGVTENSDCITVIVSEETGKISFARNGVLTRNVTADTLRKILRDSLIKPDEGKSHKQRFVFWRRKKSEE